MTCPLNPPTHDDLRSLYRTMLRIRLFEEGVADRYPEQEMRCPVHLCIGQEAVPAGVCLHLADADYLVGTHRSHGHCIAKGMSLREIAAELYGKAAGCAGGKGGSMHLVDPARGVLGTTAIVGGSMPIAVGAALASDLRRDGTVSVAFFGDGAAEQGTFHESLGFASLRRLPVLFVCENNGYATNSPQCARQPEVPIAARAAAYGVPGLRGDGNDVLAVSSLAAEAVERAREGRGPTLLEFETYRWKGHVGPDEDGGTLRPLEEHLAWKARCPIDRCRRILTALGVLREGDAAALDAEVRAEVEDAFAFAKAAEFPSRGGLHADVY